jgi:NAD(P)-dependent dehydrogenase (short-subunit alcohol dehydrogenase family)
VLVAGDLQVAKHCRDVIKKAIDELGGIDILVNNAAHQATFQDIGDISDEEWEKTFRTNIHAMFYLTKAAVPHMKPGSAIINTASVNSDMPNPMLLAYATTKGAIQNFTGGLAQMLAEKGVRANAVAPGPIWTALIPSTMSDDAVKNFGKQVPMKRPGQPAELATTYVMLADPLSSFTSGTTVAVTGGKPSAGFSTHSHPRSYAPLAIRETSRMPLKMDGVLCSPSDFALYSIFASTDGSAQIPRCTIRLA